MAFGAAVQELDHDLAQVIAAAKKGTAQAGRDTSNAQMHKILLPCRNPQQQIQSKNRLPQ